MYPLHHRDSVTMLVIRVLATLFFFKLRGSGSNRQVTDFNVKVGHKFLHFTHEISS